MSGVNPRATRGSYGAKHRQSGIPFAAGKLAAAKKLMLRVSLRGISASAAWSKI